MKGKDIMKRLIAFFCIAMTAVGTVRAATYSDMSVDVSALPKEKRFVRVIPTINIHNSNSKVPVIRSLFF